MSQEDIMAAYQKSPSGQYLVYQTVQRYDPAVRRKVGQTVKHGLWSLSPMAWMLESIEHAGVDIDNGSYMFTDHGDESLSIIHDFDDDLRFEFYPHDYFMEYPFSDSPRQKQLLEEWEESWEGSA